MIPVYQNKDFLFIRKPHGIPSTFGAHESFLELLSSGVDIPVDISEFDKVLPYLSDLDIHLAQDPAKAIQDQISKFSKQEEYGLLNRLDNDTA